MKTKLAAAIIVGLAFAVANDASANPRRRTPVEASDAITGIVSVSGNSVARITRLFGEHRIAPGLNLRDYRALLPEFQRTIEVKVGEFERRLKQEVLEPLRPIIAQIQLIERSTEFSDLQKEAMYEALERELSMGVERASAKYAEILADLYAAAGNIPYRIRVEYTGAEYRGQGRVSRNHVLKADWLRRGTPPLNLGLEIRFGGLCGYDGECVRLQESYGSSVFQEFQGRFGRNNAQAFYRNHILPLISRGCQSQTCVILRATDLIQFMTMVQQVLDRDLTIPTRSSKSVTIRRLGLNLEHVLDFLHHALALDSNLPVDTE